MRAHLLRGHYICKNFAFNCVVSLAVFILRHSIKACLVLCPLLGLSWIFGVFVATETGLIFQYLFAILNSLQVLILEEILII